MPAPSLPRPTGRESGSPAGVRRERAPLPERGIKVHHVTADYRYVKTDLIAITIVSAVTMAFILGVSFFL